MATEPFSISAIFAGLFTTVLSAILLWATALTKMAFTSARRLDVHEEKFRAVDAMNEKLDMILEHLIEREE